MMQQTLQQPNQPVYYHQQQHQQQLHDHGDGEGGCSGSSRVEILTPGSKGSLSSQNAHHNYIMSCYQNTNGWAGVPLISTNCRRPRKHNHNNVSNHNNGIYNRHLISSNLNDFDENAMSKLAMHAHGAPLILAGRYRHKAPQQKRDQPKLVTAPTAVGYKNNLSREVCLEISGGSIVHHQHIHANNRHQQHLHSNRHPNPQFHQHYYHQHANNNTINNNFNNNSGNNKSTSSSVSITSSLIDSLSVNSDESSNSSNSNVVEMCLPRIIKPRKRRKKDRKPVAIFQQEKKMDTLIANTSNSNVIGNVADCTSILNGVNVHPILTDIQYTSSADDSGSLITTRDLLDEPILENKLKDLENDNVSSIKASIGAINEQTSSCSCRLCDPLCRIWAFPLRRSCSDNTEVEMARQSKNVGVIGSNRVTTVRNEWRSSPHLIISGPLMSTNHQSGVSSERKLSLSCKGSLSDSVDSGCDFLSGLNFADDVSLRYNDVIGSVSGKIQNILPSSTTSTEQLEFKLTHNNAVFSESVNEISRKMMETMDLRSCSSSSEDSASVFSDRGFSDEFLLNLDSIVQCGLFSINNKINTDVQHFDISFNTNNVWFNQNNYNDSSSSFRSNNIDNPVKTIDPLTLNHEKDRGDEVIKCFDMVWSESKLLSAEK